MAPSEAFRPHTDRLARLLADARGTEILGELQLLALRQRGETEESSTVACGAATTADTIGVWRIDHDEDTTVLRRIENSFDSKFWADVPQLRLADQARRVVLIGESVARGWIYDPEFNPALALQRNLNRAAPGDYQIIDLAKAGACPEELTDVVHTLPRLRPDCVILFAGNNWAGLPVAPTVALLDSLARALRDGGYAAMSRTFIDVVMLPRVSELLDGLVTLHHDHGVRVVVVVPEFNLQGWAPPADVDIPVVSPDRLASWYHVRDEAVRACDEGRWGDVAPLTEQLRALDEGMSPVPGTLLARAAVELGDGKTARAGFEQARDALVGIGVLATPRVTQQIQELLTAFAEEHGFPCVDLRTVLATDPLGLPDPLSFLDYCHLSDDAIESAMAVVTDTILGLPSGTTRPGPGTTKSIRAQIRVIVAAQCAYFGQPTWAVSPHLQAALDADPQITTFMTALLDLLESTGPAWAHPAIAQLAAVKSAREVLGPMLLASMRSDAMWVLRACLAAALERTAPPSPLEVNLLITADKMDRLRPDCAPRRSYRQVTAQVSTLAFALDRPQGGVLDLTYRMPAAPPDAVTSVTVNEVWIGTFPSSTCWTDTRLVLPPEATRAGVNWIHLRWPVPRVDTDRCHAADAATLARGGFPTVVPIFGELFTARLALQG